jgi:hypothetical protein
MISNCFEIENLLSEYVEGKLSDASLQMVRAHLNSCESCSLLVLELQFTLKLCRDFPELDPPPGLLEKILAVTTSQYEFVSWWDYLRELFRPLYASPRFATGTLLAAISMSIVFNALGVNLSRVSLSDLTPRSLMERFDRVINVAYDSGLRRLNDLKILYQIQSRLDELKSKSEEEEKAPQEKSKLKEGSVLLENPLMQPLVAGAHVVTPGIQIRNRAPNS